MLYTLHTVYCTVLYTILYIIYIICTYYIQYTYVIYARRYYIPHCNGQQETPLVLITIGTRYTPFSNLLHLVFHEARHHVVPLGVLQDHVFHNAAWGKHALLKTTNTTLILKMRGYLGTAYNQVLCTRFSYLCTYVRIVVYA